MKDEGLPPLRTHVRAFLTAALLAATLGSVIYTFLALLGGDGSLAAGLIPYFFAVLLVALVICLLAGVLVAVPISWLVIRLGLESWWIYPLLGFVAGFVVILFVIGGAPPFEYLTIEDYLLLPLVGGLPGAVAGAIWWRQVRGSAAKKAC